MLTTHFVTNDPISDDVLNTGLQTAYYDLSRGGGDNNNAGETFILVHGFTGSKLDFQDQLPWFADTHRVIAFDQRGHGESSNIGPYSLYTLAADLISLLDRLEIDQCHILGHSLGGMVVLRALLANPERFQSAILMDTAPYALSLFDSKVRRRLDAMVQEHGCETLLKGMQGQPQHNAVQRGIDYLGEQEHWRRIRVKLSQMDPAAFVALGEVISEQPSVLGNLSSIETPTTVMVGKHDKPFIKPSKEMAGALPNSTLVMIDNAGHSPQYENAEAWQTAVEGHLAKTRR